MRTEEIKLKQVKVVNNASRGRMNDFDVHELMGSMKHSGLINPITVSKNGKGYHLVAGHRRYSAAQKLGWKTIPAVIRKDLDSEEFLITNFAENSARKDPTLQEQGFVVHTLKKNNDLSFEEIAKRIGKSKAVVENYYKLWCQVPKKWSNKIVISTGKERTPKGTIKYKSAHTIMTARFRQSTVDKLMESAAGGATDAQIAETVRKLRSGQTMKRAKASGSDIKRLTIGFDVKKKAVKKLEALHGVRVGFLIKKVVKKHFPRLMA